VCPVIAVRPSCNNDHYWQVYFDTNEAIVRVCKEAGWPAPTPTNITRMIQVTGAGFPWRYAAQGQRHPIAASTSTRPIAVAVALRVRDSTRNSQ
jgi:hypothetical protein